MDTTILYGILLLLTSVPIAYLLQYITKDENNLVIYYFPSLLWLLAFLSAIFYTTNIQYGFVTTYLFITLVVWIRVSKSETERIQSNNM